MKDVKKIEQQVNYMCEQLYNAIDGKGSVVIMVEGVADIKKPKPYLVCAHRGIPASVMGLLGVGSEMLQETVASEMTDHHASINGESYFEEDEDDEVEEEDDD